MSNKNKVFKSIKIIYSVAYTDRVVDLDTVGFKNVQGYHLGYEDRAKGNGNQHWRFDPVLPGKNLFTLYNVDARGKKYAYFDGDATSGKAIQVSDDTPTIFEIIPKSDDATQFIIKVPYAALAWSLNSSTNGTLIKLATLDKTDTKQQWTFDDL
ncbi:hypothetical protein CPB84DRAFT_1794135 [Gymnopilus junonius]|uniref:Uncharacterized protein n=1 Tax=Gymnopilus junonius TaxID=109634 RepID=A0A9P5NEB5_GYMJU|nr:hypothetical protein CPB84DRAFT_1794135 [Gymnopilus junonius]